MAEQTRSDELAAIMAAAEQRVEERRGARSASDVVNNDTTRRPFSVRLTARELHRLRVLAIAEGEGATELARRLILEGLIALEAKHGAGEKRKVIEMVEHLQATRALIDALLYSESSKLSELMEEVNRPTTTRKRKARKA